MSQPSNFFIYFLTGRQNAEPAQISSARLYVESGVKIDGVFVRTEIYFRFAMRENVYLSILVVDKLQHKILL